MTKEIKIKIISNLREKRMTCADLTKVLGKGYNTIYNNVHQLLNENQIRKVNNPYFHRDIWYEVKE